MPRLRVRSNVAPATTSAATARRGTNADRKELVAWEDWYARQDYRKMPWHSARPSPWLVRAVRGQRFPPRTSVLDLGCGTGSNSLWLRRRGFAAAGIDISETAIAIASQRAHRAGLRVQFRTANAAALPFRSGTFGAALDNGCFHCLPIRLRQPYAREVARVLRPGSPFLLTWIPREVRSSLGPPHRPALAEVVSAFEPGFLFASVERGDAGSPDGWMVCGTPFARCTALLIRRMGRQPAPW